MSDQVGLRVPVWVDIGYRLSSRAYLALFGQVGLDSSNGGCRRFSPLAGAECDTEDWRLGLEGLFTVYDGETSSLWLGAGVGWEHLNQKARIAAPTGESTPTAPVSLEEVQQGPILELQAGFEWVIEGSLRGGPFIGYSAGTYVDRSYTCNAAAPCPDANIDFALHHFFTVGLRGAFGPITWAR